MTATKAYRVGRDRVVLRGTSLTITSPVSMPGWEVRRYRAPVIKFDGRTWRLTARTAVADKLIRYELAAWDPAPEELTGPDLDYSDEDVALRDYALRVSRRSARATTAWNLVRPLTGFLSASTKDRLELQHGIDPVASTTASVVIQMCATLGALAVASIAQMVKLYGFDSGIPVRVAVFAAAVAGVDAAVRWSRVLDEVRPAPGFYEWLFRRRR